MQTPFNGTRHHVCKLPDGLNAMVRARWETRGWTIFGLLPKYKLVEFVIESSEGATDQDKAEVKRQLLAQGPLA